MLSPKTIYPIGIWDVAAPARKTDRLDIVVCLLLYIVEFWYAVVPQRNILDSLTLDDHCSEAELSNEITNWTAECYDRWNAYSKLHDRFCSLLV